MLRTMRSKRQEDDDIEDLNVKEEEDDDADHDDGDDDDADDDDDDDDDAAKFTSNMPQTKRADRPDHTLPELAHSKCTWNFHRRHFVREFTRKMPGPTVPTQTLC